MVDISGVDKMVLLRALWENQAKATFFAATGHQAPGFSEHDARAGLAQGGIDYLCGRAMKLSFEENDMLDPVGYDRVAGKGTMERVVAQVRNGSMTARVTGEDRLFCESGKPQAFAPYGEPMLPGNDGTTMCTHCGLLKRAHEVRKV
jgi:hypothetical protein